MRNTWSQRLCVWSGVLFAVLFFLGFGIIARYIPPPAPTRTAASVASFYRDNANAIRAGMILSMYALVFFVPFTAAISVQLKRIEAEHTPLTYAQLGIGCTLPVAFFPALYYFQVAAYRPDRAQEAIQTLNDMGWLPFTGIIYAIFVQNLVIGVAVLSDQQTTQPVYPRWYGYFCLWTGLLYCPASLDVFFKDGPLAWNGLFSWWLSLVAFFAWIVVTVVVTLRAIGAQVLDPQAETRPIDSANAPTALPPSDIRRPT
ncbi:hypothetical protein [Mycobacterium marseillense]|uniref:hypothetical protein n=1 Tax=Mycobacterium marseillense TaxID=701042 RepID=UPI0011A00650|nr:hypothetical protein [Mycobacterium marseillense]